MVNVIALGASTKPERYAYRATKELLKASHTVFPVNPMYDEVLGLKCYHTLGELPEDVLYDTLTLYLNPERSSSLIDDILAVKPRRIILNPGTENTALKAKAEAAGILVEEACSIILLKTKQF